MRPRQRCRRLRTAERGEAIEPGVGEQQPVLERAALAQRVHQAGQPGRLKAVAQQRQQAGVRRAPTQQRHLLQHLPGHAAAAASTAPAATPASAPAAAPGVPAAGSVGFRGQPLHGARAVV